MRRSQFGRVYRDHDSFKYNPDEWCRLCGGTGTVEDSDADPNNPFFDCPWCNGSGIISNTYRQPKPFDVGSND
jgi:DnaJ-class molecular chaperone